MKIAHYIDTFSHLSETFVFDLLCALRDDDLARESQHFVICHQRRNEQSRPFDGVHVVGFGSPKNVFGKLLQKIGVGKWICPNEEAVAKLLLTERPDLIHAHFGQAGVRISKLLTRYQLKIPLVVQCHGSDVLSQPHSDFWYRQAFIKLSKEKSNRIIGNTDFLCGVIQSLGVQEAHLRKVTYSVNTKFSSSCQVRGRKRDSMVRVISVGRLIPWKGHRYLIDAVKILNDRTPHCVSLTIVGSGSEAGFLKKQAESLGLLGVVNFLGSVSHEDLPAVLSRHDLFVQPSIVDPKTFQRESFGMTILEAISCGLPVIVTDSGGMPELVGGNSRCSKIVPHSSPKSLAEAMQRFIETPVAVSDLIAYRESRLREFSRSNQLKSLTSIYDELLTS